MTSIGATSLANVEINTFTGDDRGGISVTTTNVYVTGDASTAKFDLNLNYITNYPLNDGIFTDNSNGNLYSLYSSTAGTTNFAFAGSYTFNQVRALDANLNVTGTVNLSSSITVNTYPTISGMFSGA